MASDRQGWHDRMKALAGGARATIDPWTTQLHTQIHGGQGSRSDILTALHGWVGCSPVPFEGHEVRAVELEVLLHHEHLLLGPPRVCALCVM